MDTRNRSGSAFLSYALKYFTIISLHCCTATDTLNQSHQLSVGQTLISAGQIFELGFFSPGNSSKQYVGIWYKNISVSKVWVANRENPLIVMGPASCLTIGSDGNLKLVDGKQNTVWSTNVSVQSYNSIAVLSDNGNFILKDSISGLVSWESFSYPCNTFLSGMKIGLNTKIGENLFLSSWQARDDPSPGNFTAGLVAQKPPQAFVWNGSKPYWRAGPWDGWQFIGVQDTDEGYSNGLNLIPDNQEGSVYLTFNTYNSSFVTFIILTPAGSVKMLNWDEEIKHWYVIWEAPGNPCDVYGACGPFGVCNTNGSPICECLKGFVPKSNEEWSKGNWTSGCVRRTELLCEKNTSGLASRRNKNDGFWKLSGMKPPDLFDFLYGEDGPGCQQWCLDNCSCKAYSYVAGIGCMVWDADLMDTQQFSLKGEVLFLRLAYSELGDEKGKIKLIISFTAISGSILLGAFLYGFHRWKVNQREKRRDMVKGFDLADSIDTSRDTSRENVWGDHALQWDSSELPIFDFDKILVATNNFSKTNRLGGGGFGPVYKGKLEDGQEIAVKRLSSHSGQGVEEFKNEIILIAKLQHRNLVRLLGCCIEGEEKLLIYEYMKNKSLDTFLFDSTKRVQLDWVKRFNIIQGVARGLLYLHRDSCLRVIHRDLKAGNILLDDDMNPKISDFGLARAFRATQEIANTHRVVGTFGYMSPEYAIGGIISDKSDVFSFGILLLEIISSMKNTSFNYHDKYLNLIDYACKLWNECRGLDLMDQALADSCSPSEVMRCIHVGLLCVQDHAVDRPTMSAVVLMLSSETDLPQPKQPTFTFQSSLDSNLQLQCNNICSTNEVTASVIEGR